MPADLPERHEHDRSGRAFPEPRTKPQVSGRRIGDDGDLVAQRGLPDQPFADRKLRRGALLRSLRRTRPSKAKVAAHRPGSRARPQAPPGDGPRTEPRGWPTRSARARRASPGPARRPRRAPSRSGRARARGSRDSRPSGWPGAPDRRARRRRAGSGSAGRSHHRRTGARPTVTSRQRANHAAADPPGEQHQAEQAEHADDQSDVPAAHLRLARGGEGGRQLLRVEGGDAVEQIGRPGPAWPAWRSSRRPAARPVSPATSRRDNIDGARCSSRPSRPAERCRLSRRHRADGCVEIFAGQPGLHLARGAQSAPRSRAATASCRPRLSRSKSA